MDPATIQAYDLRAADFAARYAAADLAPLHRLLLAHLQPRCRVLEIGCGSGREAAFLAANGFAVTATDASDAMLEQARQAAGVGDGAPSEHLLCREPCREPCRQSSRQSSRQSVSAPRFLPAAFPLPSGHPLLSERFDAILALAVVMHLPDADLFEFAFQLRSLLIPGGTVILSLSEGRAVSSDSRAADGRLFRERPPAEVILLFERLGFRLVARGQEYDSLGRDTFI